MRIPEWIQLAVVSVLLIAAFARRLGRDRQLTIALLALLGIVAISAARFSESFLTPYQASILWDWMPGILMLIPYWQVGQFFTAPDRATEARLASFDHDFYRRLGFHPPKARIGTVLGSYLELAYFGVYPLIPLGIVTLYTAGLRREVDFYWVVVLSATYISYASTLAVRARPPRMVPGYEGFQTPNTRAKVLNREILDRASIQAITCPSAHVACALAAALVILRVQTSIGLLFLWAALSIAVATIAGRYHYVADVLSGAVLAVMVFTIACFL
jgi:hypothetical protein